MERELLLLGLLRRGDMHGYQLHEFINRYMTFCTNLKKPTAYYLLDKMAASGWIEPTTDAVEAENNRPPRRVYSLTPEGEEAFQRLLRENLAGHYPASFAGDIGLAFVDLLNPDEARELLDARREALQAEMTQAEAAPVHTGSLQLVVEHQIRHLRTELDWLDEVIARLEH